MADVRLTTNGDGTRTLTLTMTLPQPDAVKRSDTGKTYQLVTAQEQVSLPPEYGHRPLRLVINGFIGIPEIERDSAPALLNEYLAVAAKRK